MEKQAMSATLSIRQFIYSKNRIRRGFELALLYIVLPLAVMLDPFDIPLMALLLFMGISVLFYLLYDPTFDRGSLFNWSAVRPHIRSILLLWAVAAAVMVLLIWWIDETKLFYLVRVNPLLLLMISFFYPAFSIIPQGLAYRSLFFHRYGDLFPGEWAKIIASAVAFSFGHVLYKNWMVLGLTFIAGLIFSYRYYKTNSLAISVLEHALYGVWLFACGLGYFFVSGFVD